MNTDLLRNTDTWKAKWKQLKDTMSDVLSKYNESNYQTWVLHWDHQIYKALEVSYQMGLVSLNESLSDINVDLVFNSSSKSIEFKPPIESVRQQYYNEIKKFISIPNSFEGFHSNGHVFKRMCKTNMKSIMSVFGKAEALFDRLLQSVKKYAPWTKYASMDLDNYIETKVNKPRYSLSLTYLLTHLTTYSLTYLASSSATSTWLSRRALKSVSCLMKSE